MASTLQHAEVLGGGAPTSGRSGEHVSPAASYGSNGSSAALRADPRCGLVPSPALPMSPPWKTILFMFCQEGMKDRVRAACFLVVTQ